MISILRKEAMLKSETEEQRRSIFDRLKKRRRFSARDTSVYPLLSRLQQIKNRIEGTDFWIEIYKYKYNINIR